MGGSISDDTIAEMKAYYRARATEYDEWFLRQGRYDRGPEMNALWFRELNDVQLALSALKIAGDVLELAPGTGIWTEHFLKTATSVTAVDASPEMIAMNQARVADPRVSYVQADLFTWQPTLYLRCSLLLLLDLPYPDRAPGIFYRYSCQRFTSRWKNLFCGWTP